MILHRIGLGQWLTDHGFAGRGVEVGVQDAVNAERIVQTWRGTIDLVDPYVNQPDDIYLDGTNRIDMKNTERQAHERMAKYAPRFMFHKMYSLDFADMIVKTRKEPSEIFDFVYLDGNHKESMVAAEIEAFWPMVKRGGLLGGHDFGNIFIPNVYDCGVEAAVRKWIEKNPSLDLWLSTVNNGTGAGCDSWWVRKPL